MSKWNVEYLKQLQSLPLDAKIQITIQRVDEWVQEFGEEGVYISFSGGKDSTVLLDIIRSKYPNMKAMYVDTGLEYPEIKQFVKSFDNVDVIRPDMSFREVIIRFGYPIGSKDIAKKYIAKEKVSHGRINILIMKTRTDSLSPSAGEILQTLRLTHHIIAVI